MSTHLFNGKARATQTDATPEEGGTLAALTLQGVGPARNVDLAFAERINLLTGDNGLGKTFILDCAWWALSGHWAGFSVYPRSDARRDEPLIAFDLLSESGQCHRVSSAFNWEMQAWPLPDERTMIPGLLLYARVDGAFAVWDPARDYWSGLAKTTAAKSLTFTPEEVWHGIRDSADGKTLFLANGLIQDWVTWQNAPDQKTFTILKRVLACLSPPSLEMGDLGQLEPGQPTRIAGDSRLIPTIKHSYGEVPIVYASAGVRRIVALAYLIVWAWQEHQEQARLIRKDPQKRLVVLVDEIEAHLHPQWQRRILPALLQVQTALHSELQVQLLVATHSPLILASIEPFFAADKDKIFHLDLVRNQRSAVEVAVQELDFVRYGTVDSWLRSEVFELSQARSIEAEKAIEAAKQLQTQETVTADEVKRVSEQLMQFLPTHGDGFWPRWTFFASQHGVDL